MRASSSAFTSARTADERDARARPGDGAREARLVDWFEVVHVDGRSMTRVEYLAIMVAQARGQPGE